MFFLWVQNNLLLELVTEAQPPWDALRSVHSRVVQWALYLPAEAPRVNGLFCMFLMYLFKVVVDESRRLRSRIPSTQFIALIADF